MNLLAFLHLPFTNSNENCKTLCLWCGSKSCEISKEGTHQFQCWSCKKVGNAYTLIQKYYEELPDLKPVQAKELTSLKPGIKPLILKNIGVKYRLTNNKSEWIWPIRNSDKNVVALYRYNEDEGQCMSTPKPTAFTLIGLEHLKKTGPVYLLEGHWDYASFLSHANQDGINTLGVCGSSFPSKQLHQLESREVIFLTDNDRAGRDGVTSLATRMKKAGILPYKLFYLDWDEISLPERSEIPNGFDIRDLVLEFLE